MRFGPLSALVTPLLGWITKPASHSGEEYIHLTAQLFLSVIQCAPIHRRHCSYCIRRFSAVVLTRPCSTPWVVCQWHTRIIEFWGTSVNKSVSRYQRREWSWLSSRLFTSEVLSIAHLNLEPTWSLTTAQIQSKSRINDYLKPQQLIKHWNEWNFSFSEVRITWSITPQNWDTPMNTVWILSNGNIPKIKLPM